MKILVTGGCGYKGSILIPKLLKLGHKVISVDTQWFGNYLVKHKNLKNIKLDVNDIEKIDLKNVDTIIHLASIANDPMADLDKNLSWEVSALGTLSLINVALKYKVKKIIYASSGSVYGIKKERKVHEDLKLKPISLYNKVKMVTERILLSYSDKININIIRPGTVCGYSPRMRYDLTVNAMTYSALKNKKIFVFGGKQIRPNIHIEDLTDIYVMLLKKNYKELIVNTGFENLSILDIAKKISKITNAKIIIKKDKNDPRSYRMSSEKLHNKTKFIPKYNVLKAIIDLKKKYENNMLLDDKKFYSVKWLKEKLNKNEI
jgi:nucleoside-diphosphate-sugar epimerase|tara:strand:- start:601 stop:1554 length:954 start_codon:yes stop_codon:yes gene_type:complete